MQRNDFNFLEFKSGGLHKNHAAAIWNLQSYLGISLDIEQNQGNLCRDGRSQDVPNA
jgi:hypothetical protein